MKVNPYLAGMNRQYLFAEVAHRVEAYQALHPGKPVLRLGIGDVTRPLSSHVARAFASAAQNMATADGFFGYAPDGGYDFLRSAIVQQDYQPLGVSLSMDEVFISDGAKSDVANLQELFSQDALIAVTDPVYPVYVDTNAMTGRLGAYTGGQWQRLITLPCTEENGFVPKMPDHADVLYLCSPNNPTGTALDRHALTAIVAWARAHDCLIVYDAAYKAYIQQPDIPHSIYEIEGAKDCAIECCSYSKTAGFTGVRCAYTVVPRGVTGEWQGRRVSLNEMWMRRMETKFNGVSYPVQVAARASYDEEGKREIADTISYYMRSARVILDGLTSAGITCFGGVNAPYVWLKTPGGMTSWEFFDFLLNSAQVVGTPGAGFGASGEGYFRLTAFNSYENTVQAVDRIVRSLR